MLFALAADSSAVFAVGVLFRVLFAFFGAAATGDLARLSQGFDDGCIRRALAGESVRKRPGGLRACDVRRDALAKLLDHLLAEASIGASVAAERAFG